MWTPLLDSFVVLRLGASLAEDMPPISSIPIEKATFLDTIEGVLGATAADGKIAGTIELGVADPIRPRRRYRVKR